MPRRVEILSPRRYTRYTRYTRCDRYDRYDRYHRFESLSPRRIAPPLAARRGARGRGAALSRK